MNFIPLDISSYNFIKTYFAGQPYSLSIYSPAPLIAWSTMNYRSSYIVKDGILFIAGEPEGHPEERYLILPVAKGRIFLPAELSRFAGDLGFTQYRFAPGDYIENLKKSELDDFFSMEEQSAFTDYVYLTEDLSLLKGNKYSKKRNLINQFSREYLGRGRVSIEAIGQEQSAECIEFLEIWCAEQDCDIDQDFGLYCEKAALVTTLKNIEHLESMGILIRIDDKVSALGIGSKLNGSTGTLNFEKAFSGIKGLYQFLDNECARRLFSDFKYINKESDMNLPNLAESKRSYNPVMRVKSFALKLR
ncbi:MAG: phosphatidylglycerol lysyltransferase domain-containing protein [Syntrophales bacterium]|jgi:hypothetical protein|nr:phosphatidylglycerol lysyltransferase domain-containing protein [Syntrophales bacterium]